jgi:hypothetical protein
MLSNGQEKGGRMIGVKLIKIAAIYMVFGLGLGMAMGISGNFTLSGVHAHMSLLGWATMAITGMIYLMMPACASSRLAAFHFWGHNLGLPVMMASIAAKVSGHDNVEPLIAASSTLVLISLLLFAFNLLRNGNIRSSATAVQSSSNE